MTDTATRRAELHAVEARAFALLDRIEALGLIQPGRTEREVEQDIYKLAADEFGVEKHWHKRIVHAGVNGLATARENPPVVTIADDDLVFLDLGPVFDEWEADVGRSYVVGDDPDKRRLVADLPAQFDKVKARFDADPGITGADLYQFACDSAAAAGWRFGGVIAGHIVGEFPHAHLPGDKDFYRINPENTLPLRDPDPLGNARFWILEIHLVDPAGRYGGFYERLMS
jgi:Xaa-Pro dipeptidase